ncbi:MAG: hypothetical protein HQ557_18565 [Bacteroidetes bacterium]|nr:hypothetical protein [Bacteroidota bacterium]
MPLSTKQIEILKNLARQYMKIALLPVQQEKINLWKSLNRSQMQRPMVVINQLPWNELQESGELACVCTDTYWYQFELELRKTLYQWRHFPVDMVVEPFITIPRVSGNSEYGIEIESAKIDNSIGDTAPSRHYNRIINTMDDVAKIKDMVITVDEAASKEYFQEAEMIFSGIAPLVQSHGIEFHSGIWDSLTQYIGMEDVYYELYDNPDLIHACLNRLTESLLSGVRQVNEIGFFNDIANTCHCSYVYDDEFLPGPNQGKGPHTKNGWTFGMAQLFTSVSRDIFREFEIPYITRIAREFGNLYYGCCEREDDKLEMVSRIPNIRKVSCSPWSDREQFSEKIGQKLIMSSKPTPAFLATETVDWQEVRQDIVYTMELAKRHNVNLEFILKDLSTVRLQPDRLTRWAEVAMDVVTGY